MVHCMCDMCAMRGKPARARIHSCDTYARGSQRRAARANAARARAKRVGSHVCVCMWFGSCHFGSCHRSSARVIGSNRLVPARATARVMHENPQRCGARRRCIILSCRASCVDRARPASAAVVGLRSRCITRVLSTRLPSRDGDRTCSAHVHKAMPPGSHRPGRRDGLAGEVCYAWYAGQRMYRAR